MSDTKLPSENGVLTGMGLLLAVFICGLWSRPLVPIDETRYISVAWEMWHTGDFILPRLNGEFYSHKPPLLSWLICLAWSVAGVSETAARCVPQAAALGCVFLVSNLARRLWPERRETAEFAPVVLGSMILWACFSSLLMFDVLLTFFVLASHCQLISAVSRPSIRTLSIYALAIAGGILCKGPVMLLHTLAALLVATYVYRGKRCPGAEQQHTPAFSKRLPLWVGAFAGIAMACIWVVLACYRGGPEFTREILWKQSAHRVVNAFDHARPLWWYLPLVPVLAVPWPLGLQRFRTAFAAKADDGLKFCLLTTVAVVCVLSFVSGKQIHYPLPLVPLFALMVARTAPPAHGHVDPFRIRLFGLFIVSIAAGMGLICLRPDLLPLLKYAPSRVSLLLVAVLAVAGGVFVIRARLKARPAVYSVAVTMTCAVCLFLLIVVRPALSETDLSKPAQLVARYVKAGHPVAALDDYDGQLHFPGRIKHPFAVIPNTAEAIRQWQQAHPDGLLITFGASERQNGPGTVASFHYAKDMKARYVTIRRTADNFEPLASTTDPDTEQPMSLSTDSREF